MSDLLPWAEQGLCRTADGDWVEVPILPRKKQREAKAVELAICAVCPVIEPCLEHALTFPELAAVWGGTVPKEREAIRRKLKGR